MPRSLVLTSLIAAALVSGGTAMAQTVTKRPPLNARPQSVQPVETGTISNGSGEASAEAKKAAPAADDPVQAANITQIIIQ